jgi:hypothetical protein
MLLRATFIFLAIDLGCCFQGIFGYYGGNDEIMKHAREGKFAIGKKLHHVYTRFPIIDDVLPMSVGMWDLVLH